MMERITIEAKDGAERKVKAYLEANASDRLAGRINRCGKSLADALRHAGEQARKAAGGAGGCVCAEDEDVFGWVVHFFEDLPEPAPAPFEGVDIFAEEGSACGL